MIAPDEIVRLRLRVAGLPGLDVVGLFAYFLGDEEDERHLITDETVVELQRVFRSHGGPWQSEEDLFVSTADARTRDALARWVAERVGLWFGSTAPTWWAAESDWWLSAHRSDREWRKGEVPALGDLSARDHRCLADGSRWVDAAALAEVVRHLADWRRALEVAGLVRDEHGWSRPLSSRRVIGRASGTGVWWWEAPEDGSYDYVQRSPKHHSEESAARAWLAREVPRG